MRFSSVLLVVLVGIIASSMVMQVSEAAVASASVERSLSAEGILLRGAGEIDVDVDTEAELDAEMETDNELQHEIAAELAVEDADPAPAAAATGAAAAPAAPAAPVAPAVAAPAVSKKGKKNATYVALKKDVLLTKEQVTCFKSKKVRAVVLRTKAHFDANVAALKAGGVKAHAFYTPKIKSADDRVIKFTARLANHNITRVWIRLTGATTRLGKNEVHNFQHVVKVAAALSKNKKLKVGIFSSKAAFRRHFGKRGAGELANYPLWLVGKKRAKEGGDKKPHHPNGKAQLGGQKHGAKAKHHKKMMMLELENAPAASPAAPAKPTASGKNGGKVKKSKKKWIDAKWAPVITRRKIAKGALGKDGKPKKAGSICGVKAEVGRRRRKHKKGGKKSKKTAAAAAAAAGSTAAAAPAAAASPKV